MNRDERTRSPESADRRRTRQTLVQDAAYSHRRSKGTKKHRGAGRSFPVVGVGASAGSLEALTTFFGAVPRHTGAAFVLVAHLDPAHRSLLVELLDRHVAVEVREARHLAPLEPDHLYVMAPNRHLTIDRGKLRLGEAAESAGARAPIDGFFRSLADDTGELAVGVVLSGSGSDGASGIEAIKSAGGMAMVQEPETAPYDAMPKSAVATGVVDFVLPVEMMPTALVQHIRHARSGGTLVWPECGGESMVADILKVVRERTGADFASYKRATLLRRIERRCREQHFENFDQYRRHLLARPDEVEALFAHLVQGESSFFRDANAWRTLSEKVVRRLLEAKDSGAPVRVWVPGCATGEEAYALGMLLLERAESLGKEIALKVFATDIDRNALEVARAGIYSSKLCGELSRIRVKRFFEPRDGGYQVTKRLRETIVFARQNLMTDPPFTHLDLISCRNVLLHFEPDAREQLVARFRFALNGGACLFLGSSEHVGPSAELFTTVSKKWGIYRRVGSGPSVPEHPSFHGPGASHKAPVGHPAPVSGRTPLPELLHRALLERFAPAAVVLDATYRLVYLHGATEDYLSQPSGEPTSDFMAIARPELRPAVRRAIESVLSDTGGQVRTVTAVRGRSATKRVELTVARLGEEQKGTSFVLVAFRDVPDTILDADPPTPVAAAVSHQLDAELKLVQRELQTTRAMQRANAEGLRTANDEMISLSDELHAAEEKLKSVSQELTTVNTQLQDKVFELERTRSDLEILLSSTEIATLVLDTEFRIRRFTPAILRFLNLIPSDVGRSLRDLSPKFSDEQLFRDAERVRDGLVTVETEVLTETGNWYLRRLLPYRDRNGVIEGVVINLIDISERKRAEELLFAEKERAQVTLDSIGDSVIATGADGKVDYMNPVAEAITEWAEAEAQGRPLDAVFSLINETSSEPLASPVARCLEEGAVVSYGTDSVLINRRGERYAIRVSAAPIRGRSEEIHGVVLVFSDVTHTRRLAQELSYQATHDPLTGLVNRRAFEHELRRLTETARAEKLTHALCYLDLDQFKLVNDTCGHVAGDELLRRMTVLLRSKVRKGDTLARLGGDEFGILVENCSLKQASRVANSVRKAVERLRFIWDDKAFNLGVSIGVVPIHEASGDITQVLSAADRACYVAKDIGRNRVHVYQDDDEALVTRHNEMEWVSRINQALEQSRLFLSSQRIVPLRRAGGGKEHFELLLRMIDEDGRIVMPATFLPAAERYNLTPKLDRWVVGKALRWLDSHPRQTERLELCCINLSGQSLADDKFLGFLLGQLKSVHFPPSKICFELTETAALGDLMTATRFMKALRKLGCRFALDDFGSGLSNFTYLKNLPADFLKIDGAFVQDIVDDPIHLAMVRSINEIAKAMGKRTIAEFVATNSIWEKLRAEAIGVDFIQGYAVSRPERIHDM